MPTLENILVVGSGGREHAIVLALLRSKTPRKIFVAPGNGGTDGVNTSNGASSENIDIQANDLPNLVAFAKKHSVSMVVIGPEAPLASGLADALMEIGIAAFGPSAKAAQIESSKAFSKDFMERHAIPTARYAVFTDIKSALTHLREIDYPVVIKASGLAAGKGVILPNSLEEGEAALHLMMNDHKFGTAGDEVIIEERLIGEEVSFLAFTDGKTIKIMPPAQDHKRLLEYDKGPNTGGMGAFAPAPILGRGQQLLIQGGVLNPTIEGMASEGKPFVGVIYAGIMLTNDGPMVLEFNCRFGDPETQVILPLLKTDIFDIMNACVEGNLDQVDIEWAKGAAATVVAASEGYPGSYEKGRLISGIEAASSLDDVTVFHAGTTCSEGNITTAGGRVLAVTGKGDTLHSALKTAYVGLNNIHFDGLQSRQDIGFRALGGRWAGGEKT